MRTSVHSFADQLKSEGFGIARGPTIRLMSFDAHLADPSVRGGEYVMAIGLGERIRHSVHGAGSLQAGINALIANANVDRFLGLVLLVSLLVGFYLVVQEVSRAMGNGALLKLFFAPSPDEPAPSLQSLSTNMLAGDHREPDVHQLDHVCTCVRWRTARHVFHTILPGHHLSAGSKSALGLVVGLIGTMAALFLGLLIATPQGSCTTRKNEFIQMAANVILMDHAGPLREGGEGSSRIAEGCGHSMASAEIV